MGLLLSTGDDEDRGRQLVVAGRQLTRRGLLTSLMTRFNRDEEPRLGDGIILLHGGFRPTAGSHNYIALDPLEGTTVEVRDVPRTVAVEHHLEIVDNSDNSAPDHEALRAERDRLAEIDALLSTTQ